MFLDHKGIQYPPVYSRYMFTPRKLNKPPIREAIYTITFKEALPFEKLQQFLRAEFVKSKFPTTAPGFLVEVEGQVNKAGVITKQKQDGFSLQPAGDGNKNRLVQIRPTFLSYHNLSGYDGWEVMINELKELWFEFCKIVNVEQLAEVRVRNINHINLPLPSEAGFKDYLKLLPMIPEGVNPRLSNFFLQIQTANPEKTLQAIITEAMLNYDSTQMKLNFLLDITVFKKKTFNCNEEEMWGAFNELREYKDDIFFRCITEKTEQLFI